jgi:hypothetical protein
MGWKFLTVRRLVTGRGIVEVMVVVKEVLGGTNSVDLEVEK